MQVSAISSMSAAAATANPAGLTATRLPTKTLGQSDFLKLLAVQFQRQDPMKPIEDTSFIAQMAQFTSLDQTSAMSKDLAALRSDQQRTTANSYLGHRVTVDVGDGEIASGDVTAIDVTGTVPRLVIGGLSHPVSSVLRVEPRTFSTPATLPVSTTGGA